MTKILIVEDDTMICRLYETAFQFEKFSVETANDGEAGLDKAKAFKPTLVLLDIMMPKMNGLQVLEKMKADPELKKIPVVVLTNLSGDSDSMTALSLGAVKYIIKSEFTPKEIVTQVKEILSAYTRNDVPQAH